MHVNFFNSFIRHRLLLIVSDHAGRLNWCSSDQGLRKQILVTISQWTEGATTSSSVIQRYITVLANSLS